MSQFQHGLSNNRVKTFDLNTILSGMTQYNPYRVRLDIAYFAENWKQQKNNFLDYCSHKKYCSFACLHCSFLMNNARGAGPLKKKKKNG